MCKRKLKSSQRPGRNLSTIRDVIIQVDIIIQCDLVRISYLLPATICSISSLGLASKR